ncbi:MAG: hypothetical protein P4N24_21170 [Acidobacteriota bacterium]|nr:hypothetical protein [Acidobacteriota bacterium]
MRSDQIHRALAQGMNRFEMCQLVAKGVKATHKTGGRFEDTINSALDFLGTHETTQASMHTPPPQGGEKLLKPAA